jgi:hypothetical protein
MKKKPRFPGALSLQSSFISEGIITITCYDDVIKDCHIQQNAAFFDFLCYLLIGFAGLGIPAGVVVMRNVSRATRNEL